MENQIGPNESRKAPKIALWVTLTVVILIIIAIALYASGVFETNTNSNTNTVANTNSVANTNTETNTNVAINTNTTVNLNTNTVLNTNSATDTNAPIDTSDWQTYTNTEYGYTIKYPQGWTHSYKYESDGANTPYEKPLHYSVITSADNQVRLMLGIERKGDVGTIYYRTGIGAGDIKAGNQLFVAGKEINTWQRVFEGRTVEVFLFPVLNGVSSIAIDDHEVTASFGITESDTYKVDITETDDYNTILKILQSLSLST